MMRDERGLKAIRQRPLIAMMRKDIRGSDVREDISGSGVREDIRGSGGFGTRRWMRRTGERCKDVPKSRARRLRARVFLKTIPRVTQRINVGHCHHHRRWCLHRIVGIGVPSRSHECCRSGFRLDRDLRSEVASNDNADDHTEHERGDDREDEYPEKQSRRYVNLQSKNGSNRTLFTNDQRLLTMS